MAFVKIENSIYEVLKTDHIKMGRGSGINRYFLKNLETGATVEKTYKSNQEVEEIEIERKKIQFLYEEVGSYNFMDNSNFEQFELEQRIVGNGKNYLKEGDNIDAVFYKNKILTIQVPTKVNLIVTSAEPATKGNSVDSPTKVVELETGLKINAPLFVKTGDTVVINTETGKYVERAKL